MSRLYLLLALLPLPAALAQEPLELYMANAPPLTQPYNAAARGMVGDVVLAAIERAGYEAGDGNRP